MAWVLTRGLTTWRNEINSVFPGRDKASDGSVGDLAHQQGSSGHNPDRTGKAEYKDGDSLDEVRAIDVDKDLRNPKFTMEQLVQFVVSLARAGKYVPFRYLIFNGRIWSRSDGWKTRVYTGPNKHDHHAHFSGDYTQKADGWTGSLGLAAYVKKITTPKPPAVTPPKPPMPNVPPHISGRHNMEEGHRGTDVYDVQVKLGKGLVADGEFGPKTTAAVKDFQSSHGLKADGIVGDDTWKKLGFKVS